MDFLEHDRLHKDLAALYENKKAIENAIAHHCYDRKAQDKLYPLLKKTNLEIRLIKKRLKEGK